MDIKNGTKVNLPSNLIGNFNHETNFRHKSLLTNTQVSKILKAFANGSLTNSKLWNTQLSKIVQLAGFISGPPITPEIPSLRDLIISSFKRIKKYRY